MFVSDFPVRQYLQELHDRHKINRSGKLADYIPELTRVDPELFGLAFATTDGFVYEVGDSTSLFTIQSISKAIVYGLALEDHGREEVMRCIGVEPSGEAFNSITFDERNNRPFNPMVNSGAIAATALVKGKDHAERYQRILDIFQRFSARDLAIDEAVYRSESATGHRNRAIAFLELNFGMISGDVDEHLDLYFRQCSLLVNTVDLAIIGATLANGGLNPVTGQRVLSPENIRAVLSVMNTCGMYDYAGGWQFDVGLPAKSGVGGGITAVLPGYLGIGVWSPRLDAVGNSARGVKVCEDISRYFRLHLFEDRGQGLAPIRRFYRGTDIRSSRVRRHEDVVALDQDGYLIAICELQGMLSFIEVERVTRRIVEEMSSAVYFIFDMTRLRRVDSIAGQLLETMRRGLEANHKTMAVISSDARLPAMLPGVAYFPALDVALEHFEDMVLARRQAEPPPLSMDLSDFSLLGAWPDERRQILRTYLELRAFSEGERLIHANARARELFFLVGGRVEVTIPLADGKSRRVSTIDPGNVFGELALFDEAPRTADVTASTAGTVFELDAGAIGRLRAEHPEVHLALTMAVGRSLAERLRRANGEIQALSR